MINKIHSNPSQSHHWSHCSETAVSITVKHANISLTNGVMRVIFSAKSSIFLEKVSY